MARDAIDALVEKAILEAGGKRGEIHATLYGELGRLLAFAALSCQKGDSKSG